MFAEAAASRSVGADVGADVTRPRRVAARQRHHPHHFAEVSRFWRRRQSRSAYASLSVLTP
jgi:hypothetical protein